MSIEVVLEGQLETEKDFEGYAKLVKELSEQWHLKMETYENYALIDVCPEGYIEMTYEDCYLTISAQTNVAGPGFHAYVCDFFHVIEEKSPIALTVSDPTQYYMKKDFAHLTHEIFYRWLHDLSEYIKEHESDNEHLCISWPLDYYEPKAKKGYVITPMGYLSLDDLFHLDIETLAQRFFVWNHLGRDALYYRNAALCLLWKECYFEYSNMNEYTEKQTDTILDLLEIAYRKDQTLPLPVKEYEALCTLRQREGQIHDAIQMQSENEIGYRRTIVEFHFGNWSIPAHGCVEKSVDDTTQTLYLMAPYHHDAEPWTWMYKVRVFTFNQKVEKLLEDIAQETDAFDIIHDDIIGKAVLKTKEDHTILRAQLNSDKEMMLLEIIICNPDDISQLLEQVKQIKYRKINQDHVQA